MARGNGNSGIGVSDSANNRIGGAAAAQMNVVSANGTHGVVITGAASTGNLVQGNLIGTNRAGTADFGNGAQGIFCSHRTTRSVVAWLVPGT